ncbi:UDP-N-acetyl-D-mannosamine dehydrogenase [Gammaproteobacteria bacterium AB-CW1]|uniref:UDP-N-acetyl-D-mannosamine dehydrogenase n=1 Tax=Natronospira elongata TaxID=3110268 RepID=A0AAP6JHF3_9GAMM|nr:UDP-N-acetyl-D-mannosamine dehydrogenase [Gammaproteobacteria bacterium AB-CW1]
MSDNQAPQHSALSTQHSRAPARVCVVGLGYIGLPTAAVIASRGISVAGVDANSEVVETINRGEVQIVEPDLDIVVRSVVSAGNLHCHTEPRAADAFLIAVPTPLRDDDAPDLSYVEAAVRSVARVLEPGNVVILESTSPVGATEQLCQWLRDECPNLSFPDHAGDAADIRVAHCPERVMPGQILRELVENDRVIGGVSDACAEAAMAVYRCFVRGELIATDVRTAEMCKLAENAFRDVNIAYANELSRVCDQHGVDVWELVRLANRHPRVNILKPGPGVGGHCIAVDPWLLIHDAPEQTPLMQTARRINDEQPAHVAGRVLAALPEGVKRIACLGLSFKPNVDDLRSSPALEVVDILSRSGQFDVDVVEPHVNALPAPIAERGNVRLVSLEHALQADSTLVGLVRHDAFVSAVKHGRLPVDRLLDFVSLSSAAS